MKICFRVDASTKIGNGHVMRCIALAEKFKEMGHTVTFVSRIHKGHLCNLIATKGFKVLRLEEVDSNREFKNNFKHASWLGVTQKEDVKETKKLFQKNNLQFDWIIIDHYAIDKVWESDIRKYIPNVMVIDDVADREHDCDILLDQNYYLNANLRYSELVPGYCTLLLGPKYALLRDEFIDLHQIPKEHGAKKSLLVFYGGSDPTNETLKALKAIKELNSTDITTHVVVGPSNPNSNIIKNQCDQNKFIFHYNIDYMAKLINEVDFAICAGGSITWERYCVGTPAILTAVAYNQIEICENVQHLGVDRYIGFFEMVTQQIIENEVRSFLLNDYKLRSTNKAIRLVDGHGKTRVLNLLENKTN